VDEIQYAKGYNYLTLVYKSTRISRLLCIGRDRAIEFFAEVQGSNRARRQ